MAMYTSVNTTPALASGAPIRTMPHMSFAHGLAIAIVSPCTRFNAAACAAAPTHCAAEKPTAAPTMPNFGNGPHPNISAGFNVSARIVLSAVTHSAGRVRPSPRHVASSTVLANIPKEPRSVARRCVLPPAERHAPPTSRSIPSPAAYNVGANGAKHASAAYANSAPHRPCVTIRLTECESPAPTNALTRACSPVPTTLATSSSIHSANAL
mmetsp:Transcript_3590/g.12245  ORF Transcript_3590/g.12245 Transcript_3590/m.12245 type:complete len:211 (-) Transcript_3590:228-860(-)